MKRKMTALVAIVMVFALMNSLTGCSSLTTLEKFNTASEKLSEADNVSMDMTMTFAYELPEGDEDSDLMELMGQDMSISIDAHYIYPEERNNFDLKDMKMAMTMNMDIMGETMSVSAYFKDAVMYMGMPSLIDEYIYIDMDSPDFEEMSSATTSMQPGDFLVDILDEESITVTDETIEFRGNSIKTECLQLTVSESNIEQLYEVIGSSAETASLDVEEMIEMIDFENFIYRIYLDENDNIIRFEISYGMMLDTTGNGDTFKTNIEVIADIYDINETTIEYPDFTNAINYSDF